MCPEDFSDTADQSTIAGYSVNWDTALTNLLTELESINIRTAEIGAATLIDGQPLRFRSGENVFYEDFQYDNGFWVAYTSGTGATSALDTDNCLSRAQCWKIKAGSDGGKQAWVSFQQGRFAFEPFGIEFGFSHSSLTDYFSIFIEPAYDDRYLRYVLKLDITNNKAQIRDENGTYQDVIDPLDIYPGIGVFHFCKLIVDPDGPTYTTLHLDDNEVDLSAYSAADAAASDDTPFYVSFRVYGTGGDNPDVNIDNLALTTGE